MLCSFLPTRCLSRVLSPPLSWEMGRTLRSGSLSCPPSDHGPESPLLGQIREQPAVLVLKGPALAPRKGATLTCQLNVELGGFPPHPGHPISHTTRRGVPQKTLHPGSMESKGQGLRAPFGFGIGPSHPQPRRGASSSRRPPQGTQAPSPWLPPRARGRFAEREYPGRLFPAGDGQALGVSPKEGDSLSDGAP